MHGQPRNKKSDESASKSKSIELQSLQSQFLHNHRNKIYTEEALEISSKLLQMNPEVYTGWNYRKLAVQHNIKPDKESINSILDQELKLVEMALRTNYKSYGAWHHRKWILSKGLSSYDHEFRLLYKFQKADERNFHAWNYRRFLAEMKNVPDEEELQYTMDMLESNFSNYSAWHNRSVLLSRLLKQKATGFISKEDVLSEEYDLVHNALFVDSHDQSGWFYHHWLLQQTVAPESPILVSTWPIRGSDLIVSSERNLDAFTAYHSPSGTFPLILYFNQCVECVNSSTVSVNYLFCKEDLIWRPLSSNNSKKALAWITYLKFPEREDTSSKAYSVEVTLGHSQGIISSSGSNYDFPSRIAFTVSLHSSEPESTEVGVGTNVFGWGDDNFHACKTLSLDLSTILSLDQLRIHKDHTPATSKWVIETVTKEIAIFRELLLIENCKIGKLTLARLLIAHDSIMGYNTPFEYEKVNSEEVLELFSALMIMDPTHSRYYKDQHSLVLMEKEISKRKSLEKHCFYHGESICLRLNNMSLSKIGSFEHILWIKMLDLSHNEIQSIEGLEAMQLLSCLNLSYNKLKSLTALEPLRLLPSLEVLNVSYNEIGGHTIDTTRYLCSSPLSNSIEDDCGSSFDEYGNEGDVFTLRGLQLRQLDIAGNAVCNDNFRLVLVKVLPKLKWLDGSVVF
ncbi:protein geranylgeranyltransferase type II [Ranunculus cassubicifolius]